MVARRELLGVVASTTGLALAGCSRFDPNGSPSDLQQTALRAPDGEDGDRFGQSISVSNDGRTVAVGAPWDFDSSGQLTGSTYVFTRSNDSWDQRAKLVADEDESTALGRAVALSGDGRTVVVVGSGSYLGDDEPGTAYVFSPINGAWRQQAELAAEERNVRFSDVVVSEDGSVALIGAPGAPAPDRNGSGSVYVFGRSGGTWRKVNELGPGGGPELGAFGLSVAMSDDARTALIGGDRDLSRSHEHVASVYERGDDGWNHQGTLDRTDSKVDPTLSVAFSGDGDTALVNDLVDGEGVVLVFSREDGTWREESTIRPADSVQIFGRSIGVSSDGASVVVGADRKDTYVDGGGAAHVFDRTDDGWSQRSQLALDKENNRNSFGRSVAVSGEEERLFVGARDDGDIEESHEEGSGRVYVFD